MARPARIGILRARHDTSVTTISDRACLEMFFSNSRNESVFDYWEYVTRGWLDFRTSELMPWVDISLTEAEARGDRALHGTRALAALQQQVGELHGGFDGFIVLTHPGTITVANPKAGEQNQPSTVVVGIDGGAGYSLAGKPACSLPVMTGNHTFYCHELGHVLGLQHSYGVFNNGIDWDGAPPYDQGQVYGDPYDLMSSASFGTRTLDTTLRAWRGSPTYASMVPPGWPNPNGAASMGPAPSLAHLHQWDERMFPPGTVKTLPFPPQGGAHMVRLVSAGTNSRATSLLVLPFPGEDPEGRGRVYVEYRGKDAWDRGLHLDGTDLARRAVVVHTRTDVPGDGVRTWYRGRILVPTETDTDLAPAASPVVIQVTWVDEDAGVVEVEVRTSAPREIEVERKVLLFEQAVQNPETRRSPCGDELVWATRIQQTTTHFIPQTRGYGGAGDPGVTSPEIAWTVGGVQVPATSSDGSLEVPTNEGTFTVQYELALDPARLILVGRGGERYAVEVKATATEPGGDYEHSTMATFDPSGWTEGFGSDDIATLSRCLKSRFDRAHERVRDWLLPVPPEDPDWGLLNERININRINEVARRVRIQEPAIAADLMAIAQLQQDNLTARFSIRRDR
ncbi:hypothetical protein [Tessaracoccus sp.]